MLDIPMYSKAEAKASLRIFQIALLHAFNGLRSGEVISSRLS